MVISHFINGQVGGEKVGNVLSIGEGVAMAVSVASS